MIAMRGEKFQRIENYNRKQRKPRRRYRMNRHHFLLAKSRGGGMSLNNLLLIDIEKHEAWHRIFKNASAEEVLDLLTRVVRAKKHQG
jgi:hypothetical protein